MSSFENYCLILKIESEADHELENYENNSSAKGDIFEIPSNFIDSLSEKICNYLTEIDECHNLIKFLFYYTRKLIVYNEYSNSISLINHGIKSCFALMRKKCWLVINGILKRINQVFSNKEIEMLVKKDYSYLSSSEFLDNLCYIYIPIFISKGLELSPIFIYKLINAKVSIFQELNMVFKYKILMNLRNLSFHNNRSSFIDNENIRVDTSVIGTRIKTLKNIQERTTAMLNMVSYKSEYNHFENDLESDICGYLLKLWDEYRQLNIGEDFINQILKNEYLPSKEIRSQIIFTLLLNIEKSKLFEEVLNLLFKNSHDDYSIICLIYSRWKSIFVDTNAKSIKDKKYSDFYSLEEMRLLIWNNYVIKLLADNHNYFHRIQGILLVCYFFFEISQHSIVLSSDEFNVIVYVLSLLISDVSKYIKDMDLFESRLERAILPNSFHNTEKVLFSYKLTIALKCVASIQIKCFEIAKSIFYQLVSILLCDEFTFEKFIGPTALSNPYNVCFSRLLETESLLEFNIFKNYLFLFGYIPIQVITSKTELFSGVEFDFGSILGFSLRKSESSLYYNNSKELIQLLETLITEISTKKRDNIKNLLLIYIDLLKRFSRYLIANKGLIRSKYYIEFNDLDSFYSYIILYLHIHHFSRNYLSELNEHTIRSLHSLPKPKYGKDEIIY